MPKKILDHDDVWKICDLRFVKPASEVAVLFGVDPDTVNLIWNNRRRKNCGHPNQYDMTQQRLKPEQVKAVLKLLGKVAPDEVGKRFGISEKRVMDIWRYQK